MEGIVRQGSVVVRSQVGSLSDHPFLVHVLENTPFTWYPAKQVYVAEDPSVVPSDRSTFPFSGSSNGPQSKISPRIQM